MHGSVVHMYAVCELSFSKIKSYPLANNYLIEVRPLDAVKRRWIMDMLLICICACMSTTTGSPESVASLSVKNTWQRLTNKAHRIVHR
jgi:hypothetical protein